MTITKDEFNGLGRRITCIEGDMRECKTKVERNEKDVENLYRRTAMLPWWIVGAALPVTAAVLINLVK